MLELYDVDDVSLFLGLIDQVQWRSCDLFKKVKDKYVRWYALFDQIRQVFLCVVWDNWKQFFEFILDPRKHPPPNWYGAPISAIFGG